MKTRFCLYLTLLFFFCQFSSLFAEPLPAAGFYVDAAALYWRVQENGLGYAVESHSSAQISDGKIKSPSFDWDFGFQVGIGYRIPHDRWELLLFYTSLQTHTDHELKSKGEEIFFPVWQVPQPSITFFADEVKMHWRLHLGVLDLLVSRNLCVSSSLSLMPQIGVRTAWIRQKFNLEYKGGNLFPFNEEFIRMKNKYWGIGPDVKVTGKWNMGMGFHLEAAGGVSLLFGQFYLHQDEDTFVTKEKILGMHNMFKSAAPVLETRLGIIWERSFTHWLKRFCAELGWDQWIFFSQNQLIRFIDGNAFGDIISNQGDLSIAGFDLSFRLDF